MQIPKPTTADKERFRALVPDRAVVEVKPMFGNLGAFVNGNMFMGLFGAEIGVKLTSPELERARAAGGGPFGPSERPMSGYVSLPAAATAVQMADWIEAAFTYVSSLPPKRKSGVR